MIDGSRERKTTQLINNTHVRNTNMNTMSQTARWLDRQKCHTPIFVPQPPPCFTQLYWWYNALILQKCQGWKFAVWRLKGPYITRKWPALINFKPQRPQHCPAFVAIQRGGHRNKGRELIPARSEATSAGPPRLLWPWLLRRTSTTQSVGSDRSQLQETDIDI